MSFLAPENVMSRSVQVVFGSSYLAKAWPLGNTIRTLGFRR